MTRIFFGSVFGSDPSMPRICFLLCAQASLLTDLGGPLGCQ